MPFCSSQVWSLFSFLVERKKGLKNQFSRKLQLKKWYSSFLTFFYMWNRQASLVPPNLKHLSYIWEHSKMYFQCLSMGRIYPLLRPKCVAWNSLQHSTSLRKCLTWKSWLVSGKGQSFTPKWNLVLYKLSVTSLFPLSSFHDVIFDIIYNYLAHHSRLTTWLY